MAKNSFLEWDTTASNNTDIAGIGVLGTNAVSNFDDAFRTLMAQLRSGVDGEMVYATKSGNYTAVANDNNAFMRFSAAATLTLTAASTLGANWHLFVIANGGDVVIDPNASETIDGKTTLTVRDGTACLVICDGTNFRTNQGGDPRYPKKHIDGLTLSNNASDATNDIDIAIGQATSDGTIPYLMLLNSGITKRLDAAWTVGSGNGGRMSAAAIADTTYHVWLIQRSDTGVVDVGFDVSATAPTMPANYDRKRRIGSIIRSGATILPFTQVGYNKFMLSTAFAARNNPSALASSLLTFACPGGIVCEPILSTRIDWNVNSSATISFGQATVGSASIVCHVGGGSTAASSAIVVGPNFQTNTSQQIYASVNITAGTLASCLIINNGWVDTYL